MVGSRPGPRSIKGSGDQSACGSPVDQGVGLMRFALPPARLGAVLAVTVLLALLACGAAVAAVPLTEVSSDPSSGGPGQHATEVEPDTFAFGDTIVSAFQVGRINDGGAMNNGWATSTD